MPGEPPTRALELGDNKLIKTFAVNDQIAVIYTNTGGTVVKAASMDYCEYSGSWDGENLPPILRQLHLDIGMAPPCHWLAEPGPIRRTEKPELLE